eukprot:jgi/Antlo1/1605/467
MSTRTFKNIRIFVQLFTMLLVLTSLGFFGERLFDRDFIFLDSVINKSSIFNLGFFYVSSGVLSIIFALFASCCVSSKIRVYMRVFLLFGSVVVCIMSVSLIFVHMFYFLIFTENYEYYVNGSRSPGGAWSTIQLSLKCRNINYTEITKSVELYTERCVRVYVLLTLLSIVFSLVLLLLARLASRCKIQEDETYVPPIKECVGAGFSSASLRVKRVIEANVGVTPI